MQIVISFGNEDVFSEKTLDINWGTQVYYRLSGVHRPEDYENEDHFVDAMKDQFCKEFDETLQLYNREKAAVRHQD